MAILTLNGCANTTVYVDNNAYEACNFDSFESDYNEEPVDGDNAYANVDGVTYYGYCGFDS